MTFFLRLIKRSYHVTGGRYATSKVDFEFLRRRQKYDPFYETSIYGSQPRTKIGGKYLVPIVKGSYAGPEIMDAVIEVFNSVGAPVNFLEYELTPDTTEKEYMDFIVAVRRCGVCLKGFIEPSKEHSFVSRNIFLRKELKLYADKMHLRSMRCLPTKGGKVDIILVRQNTEGEYAVLEHMPLPSMAESLKLVTRRRTSLLGRYAFELATREERRRIVCLYVESSTPLLFLETIKNVAKKYPDIEFALQSTRNAIQDIMTDPEKVDVIISESLYGGVIVNCIFGLIGSPGITAGCNIGNRYAMFEPAARSRGRSLAGKGIVNPTSALLAGVEMLKYLKVHHEADIIENAVLTTLQCDQVFTPDLGGEATTHDFVMNVIKRARENSDRPAFGSFDQPPELPPIPDIETPPYDPSYHEGKMVMNENLIEEDECDDDYDDD